MCSGDKWYMLTPVLISLNPVSNKSVINVCVSKRQKRRMVEYMGMPGVSKSENGVARLYNLD